MNKDTVTVDRNLYIGGSDIPIILGISPFKSRFQLLLEKAGIVEDDFTGNEYTEYGNELEPKIRDYINLSQESLYQPKCLIHNDVRCNVDGYNGIDTILEIKTTSKIYDEVNDYKIYLVQLLFYMHYYNCSNGYLAVYDRPSDFNTNFDFNRLYEYKIKIEDYFDLLNSILLAVEQFREDLKKVKQNPFITEEELQSTELVVLSNKVIELENSLAEYKKIEEQYSELKARLFELMVKKNIKKWTTNSGVQITRVDEILPTITKEKVFDEKQFKNDHEDLYNNYVIEKEKIKKGRSGYIKITL